MVGRFGKVGPHAKKATAGSDNATRRRIVYRVAADVIHRHFLSLCSFPIIGTQQPPTYISSSSPSSSSSSSSSSIAQPPNPSPPVTLRAPRGRRERERERERERGHPKKEENEEQEEEGRRRRLCHALRAPRGSGREEEGGGSRRRLGGAEIEIAIEKSVCQICFLKKFARVGFRQRIV